MEKTSDFDFYLKFTKPLILGLPEIKDRILAAAWVQKLAKDSTTTEKVRLDHLKLLLFVLQRKKLAPPFTQHPNAIESIEQFPENQTLVDVAKKILESENEERREKYLKLLRGEGDFPPYISDFSADLLEYIAVQTIDDFGVHAYYAVSKLPLSSWYRVDTQLFPKAAKSMLEVSIAPPAFAEPRSLPEIVEIPTETPTETPTEEPPPPPPKAEVSFAEPPVVELAPPSEVEPEPKEETPQKKKESPRKSTLGASPPSRPIGKISPPADEWEPPTWGSNLLEAKLLDEGIEDIAKQIEGIDDFFSPEPGFSPEPSGFPAEILWSSPPPFPPEYDESSPKLEYEELPSFDEAVSPELWTKMPSPLQYVTPSPPRKRTPPPPPPPKKLVKKAPPKIKQTRSSQLLQKKKEAEKAPPPPPPVPRKPKSVAKKVAKPKAAPPPPPPKEEEEIKKVIKKPSKGKVVKKKPSKGKVPPAPVFSSPGEPFAGFLHDDVEEYLTEFNAMLGEMKEQYRKDLEDYQRAYPEQEEPPVEEVAIPKETKPKRRLSRLAKLSKPKIPKAHGAAVDLEKSIHVSPEAKEIFDRIVEGPSTSTGLTKYPKSRLRAPKPRLKHPPKKKEEPVETIEEAPPIDEELIKESTAEEDFANMESVHGHRGKDARIVSKINEMIQEALDRHGDTEKGYQSILEEYREEDRRRLQAIKARYFPERTPPRQPSEELEQMEEYYRPQTPEEEKKAIREFKAETYDRTKEVRPEKLVKIRQKTIETTPSGHVLEEYREEDRRRLQAIKARYFSERTPPRQPSEEPEQMEEYYRPRTPEEEKKAIREFKAETYDRTKEVRPEKTFKIRRETIETTPSGHVVPTGASPEYSPEVQELLEATISEVAEVSDEDLQTDMVAEQADIDELAAMEKQFQDEHDEYMKFLDEQVAEDAPEVISPRGRSPEATVLEAVAVGAPLGHLQTDMVAEPIGADDFEAMERQIEDEMRRAGEDPHAKPKRKQTRKEYEESRKRFLDVHRVTDAQMEELEAAADFVEPIDLDDFEATERRIEEEMRRAGQDPHAKPKRKQTRKEYEKSKKRFLDVHRVTDAQMEELEAAPDFVGPPPPQRRQRKLQPPPPVRRGRKPLSPVVELEEDWVGGSEFFQDVDAMRLAKLEAKTKPMDFKLPDFPKDIRFDEEDMPEEFFDIDFVEEVDEFEDELDLTLPSKSKQQTDDILLLYREYYKSLPAYTDVPVTTPRRTVTPERSPEARGGPIADLIEIPDLSPTENVEALMKKYRPKTWLPESPPVSEIERRPLPSLEDVVAKYSPGHFQAELESPGIQYEQMKVVPTVDLDQISPRRRQWFDEVEEIHNWLWGTPTKTQPTIFDVPGEKMYAESPPTLGSPVSPLLSPPMDLATFKEDVSTRALRPPKGTYRRRIGGKTIVERRSRPPGWASTIPEAPRETPSWFTDEDIELVGELAQFKPIKWRRRIPFPLRSMRYLERRSPAPRLGQVEELYESPEKLHPDLFDLPPIGGAVREETPPLDLFPGVPMTLEDYEKRMGVMAAQAMPKKEFGKIRKQPALEAIGSPVEYLETTPTTRRPAPPSPGGRQGVRRRTLRKKLKKRALDFEKEPQSADEERVELTDVETEVIEDERDLSTPPYLKELRVFSPHTLREALDVTPEGRPYVPPTGSPRTPVARRIEAEQLPEFGPLPEFSPPSPLSEWGVAQQQMEKVKRHEPVPPRKARKKVKKEPGLERLTEQPLEERAAAIGYQLEQEVEAQMRAEEEAERRARSTLLDEDVPEHLPSPVKPPPLVPGYQTPPQLRRKPITPPQRPIRIMPRSFRDVLSQEEEPVFDRTPPEYPPLQSPVPFRTQISPMIPPPFFATAYRPSPDMLDEMIDDMEDEGNVLLAEPAPDLISPMGMQLVAEEADRIQQLAAAQYAALASPTRTPPRIAVIPSTIDRVQQAAEAQYASLLDETPPHRTPTPPRRMATPPRREPSPRTPVEQRELIPVDEKLIYELVSAPRKERPKSFDPRFWYAPQIPESLSARLEEEEKARLAELAAAEAAAEIRGPEVVEFEYQETVKEQKPTKTVKPASKVAKALKGKGKIVPPKKPEKKPVVVKKKELEKKDSKPTFRPGGKAPVKFPGERGQRGVKITKSQISLKKVSSKLDTGRKKKKKEEVKKPEPEPIPPPLEFDYDLQALQELSVSAADLHGMNLLDVDAEDMPELVPAGSPERPHDPHWPRRWVRPSKKAVKMPALTETEEEYQASPMGFNMRWDLSPASRVAMRAPEVKVLPELLKEPTFQFEKVQLEPSPERAYYQPMPIARGEDLATHGLESEELPEFVDEDVDLDIMDEDFVGARAEERWQQLQEDQEIYQLDEEGRPLGVLMPPSSPGYVRRRTPERSVPSPVKGDLHVEEHYDPKTQTMTKKVFLGGKFMKVTDESTPSRLDHVTPPKSIIQESPEEPFEEDPFARTPSPFRRATTPSPRRLEETPSPFRRARTPSPRRPEETPSPFRKARTPSPRRPSPEIETPSPFRRARTPSPKRSPLASTPSPFLRAATPRSPIPSPYRRVTTPPLFDFGGDEMIELGGEMAPGHLSFSPPPPESPPPLYVEHLQRFDIAGEEQPEEFFTPPTPMKIKIDRDIDIRTEAAPHYYSPVSPLEVEEHIDVFEGEEAAPEVSPFLYESPEELPPQPELRQMHPSPPKARRLTKPEYDPMYLQAHGLPQIEREQLPPTPQRPKVPKAQRRLIKRRLDFDQPISPPAVTQVPKLITSPQRRSPERPSLFPPSPPTNVSVLTVDADKSEKYGPMARPAVSPKPRRSLPSSFAPAAPTAQRRSVPPSFMPAQSTAPRRPSPMLPSSRMSPAPFLVAEESPGLLDVVSPVTAPRDVRSLSPVMLQDVGPNVLEAVSPVSPLLESERLALEQAESPGFQWGGTSPIPEELQNYAWLSPKIIDFPGYR